MTTTDDDQIVLFFSLMVISLVMLMVCQTNARFTPPTGHDKTVLSVVSASEN